MKPKLRKIRNKMEIRTGNNRVELELVVLKTALGICYSR